jgi:uncharacterized membrane protein YsdA (DUF1294 family)
MIVLRKALDKRVKGNGKWRVYEDSVIFINNVGGKCLNAHVEGKIRLEIIG